MERIKLGQLLKSLGRYNEIVYLELCDQGYDERYWITDMLDAEDKHKWIKDINFKGE